MPDVNLGSSPMRALPADSNPNFYVTSNYTGGGSWYNYLPGWLGAAGSFIGGLLSNRSQSRTNQMNMNFQREMYARQRADALSDWDRQNAYNSPIAQMDRFKAAGLNPNLIYGQMSNSPSVRSSSDGSSPGAKPADYGFIADVFNQFFMIQKMQADTNQIEALTRLARERALGVGIENDFKELSLSGRLQTVFDRNAKDRFLLHNLYPRQANLMDVRADNLVQSGLMISEKRDYMKNDELRKAALHPWNIQNATAKYYLLVAQKAKTWADKEVAVEMARKIKAQTTGQFLSNFGQGVKNQILAADLLIRNDAASHLTYNRVLKTIGSVTNALRDAAAGRRSLRKPSTLKGKKTTYDPNTMTQEVELQY